MYVVIYYLWGNISNEELVTASSMHSRTAQFSGDTDDLT
jgi:hypothetical protein